MENIKRYECDCYAGHVWMEEKALGDYVRYEDHYAIVEKLKAQIEGLEADLYDANMSLSWED